MRSIPVQTYVFRTDPRVAIRGRAKQLMQLARYARLGTPGELLGWDDVDLVRFHELYQALTELESKENPIQSYAEDL